MYNGLVGIHEGELELIMFRGFFIFHFFSPFGMVLMYCDYDTTVGVMDHRW